MVESDKLRYLLDSVVPKTQVKLPVQYLMNNKAACRVLGKKRNSKTLDSVDVK